MNCESISAKYFKGSKPQKFSPAKLYPYMVYITARVYCIAQNFLGLKVFEV